MGHPREKTGRRNTPLALNHRATSPTARCGFTTAQSKRKRMKTLLLLLTCGVAASNSLAQKTSLSASVSTTTVSTAEPFTYKVTADCDCEVSPPDLSDFEVLRQSPSRFQQTQNINGVKSSQCSSSVTYLLRAKRKGTFSLKAAKANCGGKEQRSQVFRIQALEASEVVKDKEGKAAYYFKLTANRTEVHPGEPFLLNFYLYSTQRPQGVATITPGKAAGAWRKGLWDESSSGFSFPMTTEVVRGKTYYVLHLRKEVCMADQPGRLRIAPYFGRAVERRDFFSPTYFEGYSNDLTLDVLPVADRPPDGFYGMAGRFEVSSTITATTTAVNRSVELQLDISGEGNFQSLRSPEWAFPDHFLVTDPDYSETLELTEGGMKGRVRYTYVITPTKEGTDTVPPYVLYYYNPAEKRIEQAMTAPILMQTEKGVNPAIITAAPQAASPSDTAGNTSSHGLGIARFFSTEGGLSRKWWYGLSVLLLLLVGGGVFFVHRSKMVSKKGENGERQRTVETALKTVEQLRRQGVLDGEGVQQLRSALDNYLMARLNIGRSQLAKGAIAQRLKQGGASASVQTAFDRIWDRSHMAQYASLSATDTEQLIAEVHDFLHQLHGEKTL